MEAITGAASPRAAAELEVEFCGATNVVLPGSSLSFGRLADIVIDDNPYLHRLLGVFVERDGLWWLQNVGSRIVLDVADRGSASIFSIKPGAQSPVPFGEALVRFSAGRSSYEISVRCAVQMEIPERVTPADGEHTITMGNLPMTRDQLRLVLALAEPSLRDPYQRELAIPSNRQAAQRLGWTITRFNRKLDNVCQKLSKRGVPGLHGDIAELATDRRRRLVEYAIASGMVTPGHLVLLDADPPGTTPPAAEP